MDSWHRLEALFLGALELSEVERPAYLAASTDDPDLRAEVEAMLRASEQAPPLALEVELVADRGWAAGEAPAEDRRAGERIGAYKLIERIGAGGMGDVYRAERVDGEFVHTVAVKLLRGRALDRDAQRRFRAERQILARLDHPNITKLLDGGTTDYGQVYLVMEAVEGETVTDYCDRLRLAIDERLRLFVTICESVQYAHASLVVHRDLKPANVLVTADGRVKLLDFGIAKLLDEDDDPEASSTTQTGLLLLTPDSAAPEQIEGGAVTAATDVHGLGLLLYELLTGVHPFRSDAGPLAAARAVTSSEPERPSQVARRVETPEEGSVSAADRAGARGLSPAELSHRLTGDLDVIVMKALRKEVNQRYSSVDQMASDVIRHMVHLPIQARRETRAYRARKFVRRNRGGVSAAALVATLMVSFSAVTALQARTIARERDAARDERDRAEQATDLLLGLFESADPARTLGDTVPVGAFLEQGVARAQIHLASQPLVRSEALSVIAGAFHSLGNTDRAAELYDSALVTLRSVDGDHRRDEATLTFRAGELALQGADIEVSEEHFRRHLAVVRDLESDTGVAVLDGMRKLRQVLHRGGKLAEADSIGDLWLERARALSNSSDPRIIRTLTQLSADLWVAGDLAQAEQLARRALDLEIARSGPRHPRVAIVSGDLAGILNARSKFAEAESIGEESLAQLRAFHPNGHQTELMGVMWLAESELGLGKASEAEVHAREALALMEGASTPYTISFSRAELLLGHALVAQDRYSEAESVYRSAAERFADEFGWDYPVSIEYRGELMVRVLVPQGRFEEAERALLRDYRSLTATRDTSNPYVRNTASRLRSLYDAWGRPEEAARYADRDAGEER